MCGQKKKPPPQGRGPTILMCAHPLYVRGLVTSIPAKNRNPLTQEANGWCPRAHCRVTTPTQRVMVPRDSPPTPCTVLPISHVLPEFPQYYMFHRMCIHYSCFSSSPVFHSGKNNSGCSTHHQVLPQNPSVHPQKVTQEYPLPHSSCGGA